LCPPPPAFRRRGLLELLADHLERQELVALEPEDRLQPLELLLAEEPVAAARPGRRDEALALEVADLRDRDVRELGLEPLADRADRQQAGAFRCGGCGHLRSDTRGGTCRSGARRRRRAPPSPRCASG